MSDPNDPIEPSRYDWTGAPTRPEARRVVVTPALDRRIAALGWVPGEGGEAEWLVAQLERARRILAVEQGREGPPEWVAWEMPAGDVFGTSRVQWSRRWGGGQTATVWRIKGAWRWQTSNDSPNRKTGHAPTALEAIEACEAAMATR